MLNTFQNVFQLHIKVIIWRFKIFRILKTYFHSAFLYTLGANNADCLEILLDGNTENIRANNGWTNIKVSYQLIIENISKLISDVKNFSVFVTYKISSF